MHLSLALVSLLGFVSFSIAAPTAHDTSLVPRGRIHDQIRASQQLQCEDTPSKCFERNVQYHLKVIESDEDDDFDQWKLDAKYDFNVLRADLTIEMDDFESRYSDFKASFGYWVNQGHNSASLKIFSDAIWDIRFQIAYIWERLATLQKDGRQEIYNELVKWSIGLHKGCGVEYTPYPAGCGPVLLQIETLQKYYRSSIKMGKSYDWQISEIYRVLFLASRDPGSPLLGYHNSQ